MEWRGRRTWQFWKEPPSRHGPDEAREVLKPTIEWRDREGHHDLRLDQVEQRDGRVAVAFSWAERSGKRHEWAHVLCLRDGMIIDTQDYASRPRALRALRCPTLPLFGRAS